MGADAGAPRAGAPGSAGAPRAGAPGSAGAGERDGAPRAGADADLERVLEVYRSLQVHHARLSGEAAAARGVGITDLRFLFAIAARGDAGVLPKEATTYLGLSTGATTSLIDRLESRGLVERVPNPNDRRSVTVVIHPEGVRLVDEVKDIYREAFLAAVPTGRLRDLAVMLEAFDAELRDRAAAPGD
jgi:DNA-binding MarR family transcriptional regulator